MRYFLFVLILAIFFANLLFSQQEERSQRQSLETKENDNQLTSDSTKFAMDTLNLWRPIKTHNSISLSNLIDKTNINKRDLLPLSYFTLSDIMREKNIGFPQSSGFPGLNNSAIIFAGLPNGIDLRFNNIPQEFVLNSYTPWSIFPMENIENIEIITGSQAFILGNNSNGTLINLQEIQHHTYKPYTKLWYMQSIDETIATDGIFSQNFAKNLNLLFGFRSIFSPGTFDNQWIESWNIRTKIRWNIDSLTNLSLSENFTNYGISESGGINKLSTEIFNPLSAYSILRLGNSRLFQHNVNMSFSKFLDYTKINSFTSSVSIMFNDFGFQDREGIINNPLDSNYKFTFNYTAISNNSSYEFDTEYIDLKLGGDFTFYFFDKNNNLNNQNYTDFGVYGFGAIDLSELFNLSGGARLFKKNENEGYAFGGRMAPKISKDFTYYFDASIATRLPSILESKQAVKEIHNLYIMGLDWLGKTFKINFQAYYRYIANPIRLKYSFDTTTNKYITEYYNLTDKHYPGIELYSQTKWLGIGIDTKIDLNFEKFYSSTNQDFPLLYGNIRLYYTIISGESFIKIGLSGNVISSYSGMGYFPLYAGYYESEYKSSFMSNGLDAFVYAKLGNAHLKIHFNNLLNQNFYYTPIYPEPSRHFQFSFSWAFLD